MQRSLVLNEIRLPSVLFPSDFDVIGMASQATIIKALLDHNPKVRPSCIELLQSPLIPTRVEEEYVTEELLRIVRQNNPAYFSRLISSIFGQRVDIHKDVSYDFNSSNQAIEVFSGSLKLLIEEYIISVAARHGAISIQPAPVIPLTSEIAEVYGSKSTARFLDSGGTVVQLQHNLTVPFARMISRLHNPPLAEPLKRFSMERVFRENVVGGQPKTFVECDFDIVSGTSENRCLADAEVIKFASEVFQFQNITHNGSFKGIQIRINHVDGLHAIFRHCGVPESMYHEVRKVLEPLNRLTSFHQTRDVLIEKGLTKSVVEKLQVFSDPIEINSTHDLPNILADNIGTYLYQLLEMLNALRVEQTIIYEPLLVFSSNIYSTGMLFQIGRARKKHRLDVLAAGGRYDSIINQLKGPSTRNLSDIGICGVSISVSKMIGAAVADDAQQQLDSLKHVQKNTVTDVLVVSFVDSKPCLLEKLWIVSELWGAGISASLSFDNLASSQDDMQKLWKIGFRAIIIVKQRIEGASTIAIIKLRTSTSRHDVELSRSNLLSKIQQELNLSSTSTTELKQAAKKSISRPFAFLPFIKKGGKNKLKDRQTVEARGILLLNTAIY